MAVEEKVEVSDVAVDDGFDEGVELGLAGEDDLTEAEQIADTDEADLTAELDADEAGAKSESDEESEEPDAPEELNARLLHAAERSGLTPDDVKALGDKGESVLSKLADSLDAVSRDFAALGRKAQGEQGATQTDAATGNEGAQPKPDAPEPFSFNFSDVDRQEFGDYTMNKFVTPAEAELNSQRQQLAGVVQAVQEMQNMEAMRTADAFFEQHNTALGDIFGEGPTLKMDPSSDAGKARLKMFKEAKSTRDGAFLQGRPMSYNEGLQRALSFIHTDKFKANARQELHAAVKKRSGQIIAKPGQRRAPRKAKGTSKAMNAFTQRAAQLGIDLDAE